MKLTTIRSIFALVFVILGLGQVLGQKLISPDIEQGQLLYTSDHYFTSPSAITIYSSHELMLGKWTVEVLTKDDTYKSISCWDALTGKCLIDPQHSTLTISDWEKAKRIFVESYNRDFFQFRVTFTTPSGKAESIEFKWALLPSRPEISNVEFTISEYDWEYDMIFPYGYFSFDIYSKDAKKFDMNISTWGLFEEPDFYQFLRYYTANETLHIEYEDADWGEYIDMAAINEFGYVHSDVICTTTYITDEDILNRIEELRQQAGTDEIVNDMTQLYHWDNLIISFNEPVDQFAIYDIKGRMRIGYINQCESVDLSSLPKGIYIISFQHNSQMCNSKISKL